MKEESPKNEGGTKEEWKRNERGAKEEQKLNETEMEEECKRNESGMKSKKNDRGTKGKLKRKDEEAMVLCALVRNRKKKVWINQDRTQHFIAVKIRRTLYSSIFLIFPKMELISEFQFYSTF